MKKYILLILLLLPILSFADGGFFVYDPLAGRFDTHKETDQTVYINYDNGFEKMILTVGAEGDLKSDAFWIFPVPASPEKIVIDIIKDIPKLDGEEVFNGASKRMSQMRESFLVRVFPPLLVMQGAFKMDSVALPHYPGASGVVVHERIEKEGMISEIISAKDPISLDNYFMGRGISASKGSIPVLGLYTDKNYSFVVSWINKDYQQSASKRGIFVTFPTEYIYFPLVPTSVYGSEVVPAEIKVLGHITPEIFDNIKNYSKIYYYTAGSYGGPSEFYSSINNKKLDYTRIKLDPPSKYLTEDLWMENKTPAKILLPRMIVNNYSILELVLFLLLSAVSSIFAGIIVSPSFRNKWGIGKLALLGVTNLFTVFVYFIALISLGENYSETIENRDLKKYPWKSLRKY